MSDSATDENKSEDSFEPAPSHYVPNATIVAKMRELVALHKHELEEKERIAKMPKKPFVREEPRVGRNDPCICGSGKKYKKCCMGKEKPAT